MNHAKHPTSVPWNGVTQQYSTSGSYVQNMYHSVPAGHTSTSPQARSPNFDDADPRALQATYPSTYYNNPANYPPSSQSTNQHMYSPVSPTSPMSYAQAQQHRSGPHIPRPQSTAPHTHYSHSQSHSYSNSYSQSPATSHDEYPPSGRARSHSQAHKFSPLAHGYPQQQYTEIPIPQTIGISSDYPSSSQRPFSCDLCSLSFNRQHDLKRHRETHTGEKPFLCNGGCGKTFTRKDALKRHQLVKACGKVDESWS